VWAETEKGKRIPLDPKPEKRIVVEQTYEPDGDPQSGFYVKSPIPAARFVDTFMPHHATCPEVEQFRKRGST